MAGAWWIWMVAGFGLAIFEVMVPGYIFAGFAVAAVVTGALIGLGLLGTELPTTLVVFAVLSVASWALLRRIFSRNLSEVIRWDRDINKN